MINDDLNTWMAAAVNVIFFQLPFVCAFLYQLKEVTTDVEINCKLYYVPFREAAAAAS